MFRFFQADQYHEELNEEFMSNTLFCLNLQKVYEIPFHWKKTLKLPTLLKLAFEKYCSVSKLCS